MCTCLEAVDEAQKQCLLHLANPSEVGPGDTEGLRSGKIGSGMSRRFRLIKTNGPPWSGWRRACEPPAMRLH